MPAVVVVVEAEDDSECYSVGGYEGRVRHLWELSLMDADLVDEADAVMAVLAIQNAEAAVLCLAWNKNKNIRSSRCC